MIPFKRKANIIVVLLTFILATPFTFAQTKKLKRPSSRVGISSVDRFVRESFDLYDKVYMYDGYAEAGTPLDDGDLDVLENALDDLTGLSASAPNILSDIDGASMLKKGKATLQMNRAKKALNYSITTAKKLLTENRKQDEDEPSDEPSSETEDTATSGDTGQSNDGSSDEAENVSDNLEIYSKFDFVPGDKLLYFDDFSQDFIGDFPSKWNTNGSGEVVRLNKAEGNWFTLLSGSQIYYNPLLDQPLPEEYTIEFDLLTNGFDSKTTSSSRMIIILDDNDEFRKGSNYAQIHLPFCQYHPIGIRVTNYINRSSKINNVITADIRKEILNKPHVSIAVNKRRFRLWVNQKKYVDIPQFIAPGAVLKYLKIGTNYVEDGKEQVFIQNLKIAEGGVDLRRKLMTEGQISTNGILFDSGSANIKPQSYGIIRQIYQVLVQEESMRLNIVGHTDADGSDEANLELSKKRAAAVKDALVTVYKINSNRLETDGKGESDPVGDNNTSDGKAQNRRVVFIRI
ncbi:MAG: OmpA family protein [Flavobacteriaceae bacterium]|nr:OmpA family protein [Flavobacteriaceae bacterium]